MLACRRRSTEVWRYEALEPRRERVDVEVLRYGGTGVWRIDARVHECRRSIEVRRFGGIELWSRAASVGTWKY